MDVLLLFLDESLGVEWLGYMLCMLNFSGHCQTVFPKQQKYVNFSVLGLRETFPVQ